MNNRLRWISRGALAAAMVCVNAGVAAQTRVNVPLTSTSQSLCDKAFKSPSADTCIACWLEFVTVRCDRSKPPFNDPVAYQACLDAAGIMLDECLSRIPNPRPDGKHRPQIHDTDEDAGAKPLDVRSPYTFVLTLEHTTGNEILDVVVPSMVDGGLVPVWFKDVGELVFNTSGVSSYVVTIDPQKVNFYGPISSVAVMVRDGETGVGLDAKAFTVHVVDSFDLNEDGVFDNLDRNEAMNRYSAGEMNYDEMQKIVNADK